MNEKVLTKIQYIKEKYKPDGFIILGVFGSFARGDQSPESDIDILYELSPVAFEKYPGLLFVELYERVRDDLEASLNIDVDLADKSGLNEIGRKYILPEVKYVA